MDAAVRDEPGSCLEIFPGSPPDASVTPPHVNPTVIHLGNVPVGETRRVRVGYFFVCPEGDRSVTESGWLDETAPDRGFAIVAVPDAIDEISSQSFVDLDVTPPAVGEHQATFRMRLAHGYYDIDITVVGLAP